MPDIARLVDGIIKEPTDEMKAYLIENRQPRDKNFKYPPRKYKIKSREINRYCNAAWLEKYGFLTYSTSKDGLYCLSCVL